MRAKARPSNGRKPTAQRQQASDALARARDRVLIISLPRLFLYHRALEDAVHGGLAVVTSRVLADRVGRGISSTQVRKDLSSLGNFGRRGQGYDATVLVNKLGRVLGLDRDWRIAIVGFGYLGHALATFLEFREAKFHIAAIFDQEPSLVGTHWRGVRIGHASELEKILPHLGCSIGVITVPAAAAQSVAERLVACGVTALLNFAPMTLKLPARVTVRSIDLASELSILTHYLA
ncbi:MAG: redox-sensing transcriptional repressor Rex [Candidatus Eremiobacteraeota bacterium]|nr:redox-sensing transcriptional repressor Rex [Candidatus Eremiobacteraeota bacterium]MBC5828529.1 redox-sensing transcriptional repressor Rex [Candidatus Eremiobacteraeota bacterium]